jgi:NAD+ diphosphatase
VRYPTTVNLPFNHESIKEDFVAIPPGSLMPDSDGYWLILQGNTLLVSTKGERLELPCGAVPSFLPAACQPFCIGLWHGQPLRITAVSRSIPIPDNFIAEPFNANADRLDDAMLTLGGMAMQMLHWQKKSRYCSTCGGELTPLTGNWGRLCAACNYEHFPSIHPCSIVLVRREDEFLLVRKRAWLPGRYGLVAGFLDMGESMEECAIREVHEETGITVKNAQYVGSQCWPFPSQLMAGFVAEYASGEIKVQEAELEDARWFSLADPPEDLPPRRSIARWIMERYMLGAA